MNMTESNDKEHRRDIDLRHAESTAIHSTRSRRSRLSWPMKDAGDGRTLFASLFRTPTMPVRDGSRSQCCSAAGQMAKQSASRPLLVANDEP